MKIASIRAAARAIPLALGAAAVTATIASAQVVDTVRERQTCICAPGAMPAPGAPGAHGLIAPRAMSFSMLGNHGRLGILLGDEVDIDGGAGVRVADVVKGGPAERAGLRTGDVITALDGQPLGDDPARGIMDRMADVEPGDTVSVSYQRDDRALQARVVTGRDPVRELIVSGAPGATRFRVAPAAPARPGQPGNVWEIGGNRSDRPMMWQMQGAPGGVELVDMNEGLGDYFGTDDGALVTAVRDDDLGLRAGDVILSIGDREVKNAAHAREIIASYRHDETIRFNIVREKKRMTVSGHSESPGE